MDQVKHCLVEAEEGEVLIKCGGAVASLTPAAAKEAGDLLQRHGAKAEQQADEGRVD